MASTKRVLIVDDSKVIREYLKEVIKSDAQFEIAGEASDGIEAVKKARLLKPDVILMDVIMPGLDGLEATKKLMEHNPIPVLIFSSTVDPKDVEYAYHAVKLGAVDVMPKPDQKILKEEEFRKELLRKLKIVSNVKVIRRSTTSKRLTSYVKGKMNFYTVLAIGASTGGPAAVSQVLRDIKTRAVPVILIQHIGRGFDSGFANWLSGETRWDVLVARSGMKPEPGKVYVAPSDFHLELKNGSFHLSKAPPVKSCRPSVDVTFKSLADEFREKTLAVILTGIGDDGAHGCRAVKEKGGYVIAQDEKTSVVFGMPKAALDAGAVDTVLPLDKIAEVADKLLKWSV